jgi:hypothetical protein
MFRISRLVAAAMIIAAPALANSRYEKTFNGTVTYEGGRVLIEHRFGHVSVHTGSGNQVVARATVRASDEELGKQVRFNVSNGPEGVVVRTQFPSVHVHGDNIDVSYDADLDVTIPERAPLVLRSQFGQVEVSGLGAVAEISNRQGSISARDIHGGQIETAFGGITIEGSDGDTTVRNANGAIAISDVQGQLTVTNRFGAIDARRVDKGASFANSNGAVMAVDIKGPTSISTTFGAITAQNIGGPTSIADSNGSVAAVNIAGDLNVETSFGLVKAEHVRGNLAIHNSNGGVSAADINGDARVNTSFGSVFLKGIDGGVDVENSNGAIGVAGLRGGCNAVSLRTTFAPIKIALAPNANYTVKARTSFGTINTEVPYTVTARSLGESSSSETGVIGSGQCRMELVNSNGSITLTRE